MENSNEITRHIKCEGSKSLHYQGGKEKLEGQINMVQGLKENAYQFSDRF